MFTIKSSEERMQLAEENQEEILFYLLLLLISGIKKHAYFKNIIFLNFLWLNYFFCLLSNHFTPSKAITSLRGNGLVRVKQK